MWWGLECIRSTRTRRERKPTASLRSVSTSIPCANVAFLSPLVGEPMGEEKQTYQKLDISIGHLFISPEAKLDALWVIKS